MPRQVFGSKVLTAGTPRPSSHSLATLAALGLAAALLRRCRPQRLGAEWCARLYKFGRT